MSQEEIPCLFCQTKNDASLKKCRNCGMDLAKNHPEGKARRGNFKIAFIWIAIFCVIMMFYLPR